MSMCEKIKKKIQSQTKQNQENAIDTGHPNKICIVLTVLTYSAIAKVFKTL